MSPGTAKGRLRVHLETNEPYVSQPINVIDGSTYKLVASTHCNEEIEVPAGTYLVSATLPSGDRSVGVAEVAADELHELALTVPEASAAASYPLPTKGLEALGPGDGVPVPAPQAPPTPGTWFVRFHIQTPAGRFEPAEAHASVTSITADRAELVVAASGDGVLFAQVARPDEVPLNVSLPIYGPTISQSCVLTLTGGGSATQADVALPDTPQIDAVGRYLAGGHLQEAASLAADAEQLLQAKMANPFGAALGGYALLRLGQLDRLHLWPRNLADWFPWLADGAVIACEEASLSGDNSEAIRYACEAGRRGLPVFAPGLSVLAARLREFSTAPETAFGDNGKLVAEAGELYDKLVTFTSFADFARVSLAYRGAKIDDPAASQTPFAAGEPGWRDVTEL